MTNHQWTENTKPDRPGIWMQRGIRDPFIVTSTDGWDSDAYCFICDLPDIKDPPRYRDVCQGDVGRLVEPSNNTIYWSSPVELVAIHNGTFVVAQDNGNFRGFTFARILDDGQPKREPREVWINEKPDGSLCNCLHGSRADAACGVPVNYGQKCFREVIGQPQPTPSAEFWLNVYEDYCHMHPSQAEADAKAYKHRVDCFKVRRVE